MVLLLVGIGAGAFFWLSQSNVFAIDKIEITGNRFTATEVILEKAGPLLRGQSLLSRNYSSAEQVIKQFPYVESLEFKRDFPHTIQVQIHEYRPFASLITTDNKVFLVSADGRVLSQLEKADPAYPNLSTRDPCPLEVGQTASCADVSTGLQFLVNIPVNFNQEIAQIIVAGGDISATTKNNINIHFGTLDDYGLKFEVLRQLIARAVAASAPVTIDVSVPDRPVTR